MADAKRAWVVGFLFDNSAERVVLIRKNRPEWQAGRLNGVGGKVEPGETPAEAMTREFLEETGVEITWWGRGYYAKLEWEQGVVHFFRAFAPMEFLLGCETTTDEAIELHWVHRLLDPTRPCGQVTPNLLWLVPLGAHRHDDYDVIDVVETGTTMRKPGRLDVIAGASLGIDTCEFCRRRPVVVRVSARGNVGRSSVYSCGPCSLGPATDWNRDNGVTDVEVVALPGRAPAVVQEAPRLFVP